MYANKINITNNDYGVTIVPFWRVSTECKLRMLFCVSCTSRIRLLLFFTLWFEWNQHVHVVRLMHISVCSLRSVDTLQICDVFHTFLGLDSVIDLAVNGTVTNLTVFIQNEYLKLLQRQMKHLWVWDDMKWVALNVLKVRACYWNHFTFIIYAYMVTFTLFICLFQIRNTEICYCIQQISQKIQRYEFLLILPSPTLKKRAFGNI